MNSSRLAGCILAATALLASGCINFDKQTLVLVMNPDKDEATALLVYEGLQAGEKADEDENAKKSLEKVFADREGFVLGHPMVMIPLTEYAPEPGQKPDPKKKAEREFYRKHLSIATSSFFHNKNKELCATQVIHIKHAKEFVAGLNARLSESMREETETKIKDETKRAGTDLETLQLQKKAIDDKFQWIHVEPGRVKLTVVGSPTQLALYRKAAVDDVVMNHIRAVVNPKPARQKPNEEPRLPTSEEILKKVKEQMREAEHLAAFFGDAPLSVDQRKASLTLSIGLGDGEPIRLFSPYTSPKKGRTDPLVQHAATLKVEMLKDADAESVIADFLKKQAKK